MANHNNNNNNNNGNHNGGGGGNGGGGNGGGGGNNGGGNGGGNNGLGDNHPTGGGNNVGDNHQAGGNNNNVGNNHPAGTAAGNGGTSAHQAANTPVFNDGPHYGGVVDGRMRSSGSGDGPITNPMMSAPAPRIANGNGGTTAPAPNGISSATALPSATPAQPYGPPTTANGELPIATGIANAPMPTNTNDGTASTTPTDPGATVVPASPAPDAPQGGVTYPNGPGGPDYPDPTSPTATGTDANAPVATSGGSYTVQPGDTLSGIAAANGMSLAQIESLNPQFKDMNLIHPGETVNLGSSTPQDGSGAVALGTDASFPTSSSYPASDQNNSSSNDQTLSIPKAKHGWGDGPHTSADPAQLATAIDPHQDTDPLKIKRNDGHKSA